MPAYAGDPNSEKVTLELETPEVGLVKVWQYNGTTTTELFVPSLIFPISANTQTNGYFPQRVVLPLAKELLNEATGSGVVPPMLRDATSSQPVK